MKKSIAIAIGIGILILFGITIFLIIKFGGTTQSVINIIPSSPTGMGGGGFG